MGQFPPMSKFPTIKNSISYLGERGKSKIQDVEKTDRGSRGAAVRADSLTFYRKFTPAFLVFIVRMWYDTI